MMPMRRNPPTPLLLCGIFFLTCGTLLFELSLVRLFSVAHWYHFAFLVVSIAMLGMGAAGSFLTIFSRWRRRISHPHLSNLAFLFCMAIIVTYLSTNQIPFDQQKIAWDLWQFVYVLIYYFVLAVPPFFAGLILFTLYTTYSQQIGKLYFCDIVGAAIGSIAVLEVNGLGSGLGGIWTAALCGLFSSVLFDPRWPKASPKVVCFTLAAATWLFKPSLFSLNLSEYKALPQLLRPPDSKILHTEWTPLARLDFVQSPMVHFAPGLSLRSYSTLPEQLGIVVDGGNVNAVTRFDGCPASLDFVDHLPSALPYHLSNISSVLVCEPRGGLDFLTALHFDVLEIDGAGIYNKIANITVEKFDEFSGGLFSDFPINMHTLSPRAYLRQTPKRYDLISLPISDSFGAAASGTYGPTENYLFTVEAFTEYLAHLSESGWLVAACYILPPLRGELRLMSLAVRALKASGRPHPAKHLMAIRTLETFSILVKESPVTPDEITLLKAFCRERGFDLVFYSGIAVDELNQINRFVKPIFYEAFTAILHDSTRKAFFHNYTFDVQPTTDDRPFFGHFFRRDKLPEEFESLGRRWTAFFEGGYLVAALFLQASFLSLAFIVLPLFLSKHQTRLDAAKNAKAATVGYFFSIGLAYMLIEIVLIQRFILVLDHPLYAVSAVIASLLISSACGSYVSQKASMSTGWTIRRHLLLLCLVLVSCIWFLSRIQNAWMSYDLLTRYLLAASLLALPGFLMGFPFPVGIRKLGERQERVIPWACCANSTASVMGSSLAVLVALEWGFNWTMAMAVVFYLIAALLGGDRTVEATRMKLSVDTR